MRTVDWLAHRVTPLDLDDLDEEDFWDYDNNQSFLSELRDESVTGCQGRPGKSPDACYSFWVGASLQLLGQDDPACRPPRNDNELKFLCLCQMPRMGGIAKFPGEYPGKALTGQFSHVSNELIVEYYPRCVSYLSRSGCFLASRTIFAKGLGSCCQCIPRRACEIAQDP